MSPSCWSGAGDSSCHRRDGKSPLALCAAAPTVAPRQRRHAMRKVLGGVVLATAMATCALPALAQKTADTLRITWRDAVPDVTPYYNQLRTGIVIGHQVWDSLVYRDPETFQLKPLLAESYKWVDETTLEF